MRDYLPTFDLKGLKCIKSKNAIQRTNDLVIYIFFFLHIVKNFMCTTTVLKQNKLFLIFNRKLLLEFILSFRENVLFSAWLVDGINHTLLIDVSDSDDTSQWTILFLMRLSYRSTTIFCVYMMDDVVKDFK